MSVIRNDIHNTYERAPVYVIPKKKTTIYNAATVKSHGPASRRSYKKEHVLCCLNVGRLLRRWGLRGYVRHELGK